MRLLPLPLAILLLAACASTRTAPPAKLDFQEPMVLEPSPTDVELARKNDEELLAIGGAAFAAGDYSVAANAFSRIADLFPGSPHRATALLQAGRSYRSLGQWQPALERFRTLQREGPSPAAAEASFRVAECLYNLDDLTGARAELEALLQRPELEPALRIRALDQRGIVELELGDLEASGRSLRAAVAVWDGARDEERLDPHFAAEARYYLGEIERRRFQSIPLDPSRDGAEPLGEALERKAGFLLAAQEQYLAAVRMHDPDVVVAAGSRVAGLYEELHAQLVQAPLPQGLSAEQAALYRQELDAQVRSLVVKAIQNYRETLVFAQRAGVSNRLVEAGQASLERLQQALRTLDRETPGGAGNVSP